MDINFPEDMMAILVELYQKLNKQIPGLTMEGLVTHIIGDWLDQYKKIEEDVPISKDKAKLENYLKPAFALAGKTQKLVAKELGIDRTYLNEVVKGYTEPSIKMALLLASALKCSPGQIDSLFYVKPVEE